MRIELNSTEAKVVQAALKAYTRAPATESLLTTVMASMLLGAPKEGEIKNAQHISDLKCKAREEEVMEINHRIEAALIEAASTTMAETIKGCAVS